MPVPAPPLRRIADLPMPPGAWPVLGHLACIRPLRMHRQLEAWAAQLGTPYRLRLGPMEVMVDDDPEAAQAALRDRPHTLRRAAVMRRVMREMGAEGVFAAEGEQWVAQRRLIMGALNVSHFRGFYPQLAAITTRLHRRWLAAAARGAVIEMGDELMRYTVDVTSALAFGEDPNTIEDSGHVIQQHLASIFPMLMKRTMAPWPYWRWFKLPADRALDRDLKVVHAYAHERIARARERMARDPAPVPRNALEAMLAQAEVPGSGPDRPERQITDEVVVANVLTLLLAGEDTTAHSLAWTLLFLAQDPALQQRMHVLAVQALGDASQPPVPARYDDVKALDAFEALALEALRLKPVVGFMALEARQDTAVRGVALPRGARYFFINRPAQVSAAHFGCPQQYRPERWAAAVGAGAAVEGPHDARAFLQFGAGPRVCPGRHLATVEMRLVLAMLLRDFRIDLACRPDEVDEVLAFTNMPSRMPVRLHRREVVAARAAA